MIVAKSAVIQICLVRRRRIRRLNSPSPDVSKFDRFNSNQNNTSDKPVQLSQHNNYPWNGSLNISVDTQQPQQFDVRVRIPGWVGDKAIPSDLYHFQEKAAESYTVKVNGKPFKYYLENGYAVINRKWSKGDKIELNLPMPVRKVIANAAVADDQDRVALQRGPIIYCAEWKDNAAKVSTLKIPEFSVFTTIYEPEKLNGITELKGSAVSNGKQVSFTAIPYYAWANRGKGEMTIWFPEISQTKSR